MWTADQRLSKSKAVGRAQSDICPPVMSWEALEPADGMTRSGQAADSDRVVFVGDKIKCHWLLSIIHVGSL